MQPEIDTDGFYAYILQQYISYAPDEILKKFCNGYKFNTEKWRSNRNECFFLGLKFDTDTVFAVGVYIWKEYDGWMPEYLDVTDAYEYLLKTFNHYHAAYILHLSLKTLKKESALTEHNIILHKIYDKPYRLPKFRQPVTKHNSRERKFCDSYRDEHRGIWDKILHKSILKMGERFSILEKQRNERPSSLFFRYTPEPELHIHKDCVQRSDEVRRDRVRPHKPRGLYNAFNPKER